MPATKAEFPDQIYGGPFDPAIVNLASLVALVSAPTGAKRQEVRSIAQELLRHVVTATSWPDNAPVTWDDCGRNLAAIFRLFASHLEDRP